MYTYEYKNTCPMRTDCSIYSTYSGNVLMHRSVQLTRYLNDLKMTLDTRC